MSVVFFDLGPRFLFGGKLTLCALDRAPFIVEARHVRGPSVMLSAHQINVDNADLALSVLNPSKVFAAIHLSLNTALDFFLLIEPIRCYFFTWFR